MALSLSLSFARRRVLVADTVHIHHPVMLEEINDLFGLQPGDVAFDGTVGLGGHSESFAKQVAPGGTLVGTDWDASMLAQAAARLSVVEGAQISLHNEDFSDGGAILRQEGLAPKAALLDLGLNSGQVDDAERGISFSKEGPLDMRMDRQRGEPAAALLNRATAIELEKMLWEFGDERWARAIAKAIVERRREKPLRTTLDLVACVEAAVPPGARDKRIHFATRTFQALRIAVNKELEGLEEAFTDLAESLAPNGVLAILSYHSGEDRIVKQVFRELAQTQKFEDIFRKPKQPSEAEIRRNPRARSAKLRALRKIVVAMDGNQ